MSSYVLQETFNQRPDIARWNETTCPQLGQIIDKNGRPQTSIYNSHRYTIIETREKQYTKLERARRTMMGTLLVVCSIGLALFSSKVRLLFAKNEKVFIVKPYEECDDLLFKFTGDTLLPHLNPLNSELEVDKLVHAMQHATGVDLDPANNDPIAMNDLHTDWKKEIFKARKLPEYAAIAAVQKKISVADFATLMIFCAIREDRKIVSFNPIGLQTYSLNRSKVEVREINEHAIRYLDQSFTQIGSLTPAEIHKVKDKFYQILPQLSGFQQQFFLCEEKISIEISKRMYESRLNILQVIQDDTNAYWRLVPSFGILQAFLTALASLKKSQNGIATLVPVIGKLSEEEVTSSSTPNQLKMMIPSAIDTYLEGYDFCHQQFLKAVESHLS